jgi:hypothetical protein
MSPPLILSKNSYTQTVRRIPNDPVSLPTAIWREILYVFFAEMQQKLFQEIVEHCVAERLAPHVKLHTG